MTHASSRRIESILQAMRLDGELSAFDVTQRIELSLRQVKRYLLDLERRGYVEVAFITCDREKFWRVTKKCPTCGCTCGHVTAKNGEVK